MKCRSAGRVHGWSSLPALATRRCCWPKIRSGWLRTSCSHQSDGQAVRKSTLAWDRNPAAHKVLSLGLVCDLVAEQQVELVFVARFLRRLLHYHPCDGTDVLRERRLGAPQRLGVKTLRDRAAFSRRESRNGRRACALTRVRWRHRVVAAKF